MSKNKYFLILTIVFANLFCLMLKPGFAKDLNQDSNKPSEENDFYNGLPAGASVSCKTSGSLSQLIHGSGFFNSKQNAILVDNVKHQLGVRERIVDDSDPLNPIDIDMFLATSDVTTKNLTALFLKKIVATKQALSNLNIKVHTNEGDILYVVQDKDNNGKPIYSTIFIRFIKLQNVIFQGEKVLLADGYMKLLLSEPPRKVGPNGELINIADVADSVGIMNCKFIRCPVKLVNLEQLLSNFLGEDVTGIVNQAGN